MENLFIIVISVVLSLLASKLLPAYFSEKGKNIATKEDIEEITNKIENVKSSFLKEEKNLEKRRTVYEEIVSGLKLFISGHDNTEEKKEKFYNAYASAWLWAPDEVLFRLNEFLESQIEITKKPGSISQVIMRKQYTDIIIAMRKDAGFNSTKVMSKNYVFVSF